MVLATMRNGNFVTPKQPPPFLIFDLEVFKNDLTKFDKTLTFFDHTYVPAGYIVHEVSRDHFTVLFSQSFRNMNHELTKKYDGMRNPSFSNAEFVPNSQISKAVFVLETLIA